MGVNALFLFTACVAFLVAGHRLVLHRRHRKPTEVPLVVIAASLGAAFVFLAPAAQEVESALVPSLGRLLSNTCTLIGAFGFLHLMLYVTGSPEEVPRRIRVRLVALLLAITAMAGAFFASDLPEGLGIFTGQYAGQPTLAAYTLVYSLYLGSAVLELGALTARNVRHTRGWLRVGMLLLSVGALLAVGYLVEKVLGVLAEVLTGRISEGYCPSAFADVGCTFSIGMPALSILAIVLGAAVPTLGPQLERRIRAVAHRRAHRQLSPLRDALGEAVPGLAFAETGPAPGGISEHLYGRVVAIRDGLLRLEPHRDPADTRAHRTAAERAGMARRNRAAAVEAADIAAATRRMRHDGATGPDRSSTVDEPAPHTSLDAEISWLSRVSRFIERENPAAQPRG